MQLEDKSNSKSTSISENSDSVSSTVKSIPMTVNGPRKPSQLHNSSTHATTKSKADIMRSPTKQQKQQLKSFNFKPIERNAKPNSVVNSKANSPISPTSGSKQHQPLSYLTTTDVSNQVIARSNNTLPAPNNSTNQCKSNTLSLITRKLTDQQLVSKNNQNSCTSSSAVAKITYVPSGSEIVTSSKRVNFNLPNSETKPRSGSSCSRNVVSSNASKLTNQALFKRKLEISSNYKNIVFNGTYPIDLPLKSRFDAILEDYDPEAHKEYVDYHHDDDEDDDDDDDDDDDEDDEDDYDDDDYDDEYYENKHTAWTMQELYNDPSIPLNYKKMCSDVESSLTNFERFLESKNVVREKEVVRTFDIDGPVLDEKKNL